MDSLEQSIQIGLKRRLPPLLVGFRSHTYFLVLPSVYSQKHRGARDREQILPIIDYGRPEQLHRQAVFQLLDST